MYPLMKPVSSPEMSAQFVSGSRGPSHAPPHQSTTTADGEPVAPSFTAQLAEALSELEGEGRGGRGGERADRDEAAGQQLPAEPSTPGANEAGIPLVSTPIPPDRSVPGEQTLTEQQAGEQIALAGAPPSGNSDVADGELGEAVSRWSDLGEQEANSGQGRAVGGSSPAAAVRGDGSSASVQRGQVGTADGSQSAEGDEIVFSHPPWRHVVGGAKARYEALQPWWVEEAQQLLRGGDPLRPAVVRLPAWQEGESEPDSSATTHQLVGENGKKGRVDRAQPATATSSPQHEALAAEAAAGAAGEGELGSDEGLAFGRHGEHRGPRPGNLSVEHMDNALGPRRSSFGGGVAELFSAAGTKTNYEATRGQAALDGSAFRSGEGTGVVTPESGTDERTEITGSGSRRFLAAGLRQQGSQESAALARDNPQKSTGVSDFGPRLFAPALDPSQRLTRTGLHETFRAVGNSPQSGSLERVIAELGAHIRWEGGAGSDQSIEQLSRGNILAEEMRARENTAFGGASANATLGSVAQRDEGAVARTRFGSPSTFTASTDADQPVGTASSGADAHADSDLSREGRTLQSFGRASAEVGEERTMARTSAAKEATAGSAHMLRDGSLVGPNQATISPDAPEAGSPGPGDQWARDVVRMAQQTRDGGAQEAVLQLKPASLGSVTVRVRVNQSRVTIRVATEQEGTQTLLKTQLPALRQALEEHGLRLDEVQFDSIRDETDSASTSDRGTSGEGGHSTDRDGPPSGGNPRRSSSGGQQEATAADERGDASSRLPYGSAELRVDVRA